MSQSGVYSDLKMPWWYVRDGGRPPVPKQVQIILSGLCNQNCHFCAYRMDGYSSNELFTAGADLAGFGHNNPKRHMPTERALRLVDEVADAGVLAIQWTGGGEPTAAPDHEAIFQHAEERGMKQSLVSNGMSWSDELIAMLARFSWVRVSIDAGTAETYGKIRDTAPRNFEKVYGNVRRLAHAIRTPTPTGCVLGIGYVVTPENWGEIIPGVARAADSGASYIRLSAMFSPEGAKPYESMYDSIRQVIHEARDAYETDAFRVYDLFGDRVQDLVDGPPDYKECHYQRYTSYVGDDMNLYRCCVYAYNERGLVTDIKDRTFAEAWAIAQKDFETFDARGCERCQFNSKNRAMNYIAGPAPAHKEFP